MKKTIKKLTVKDITRGRFCDEEGQRCALGWINYYTDPKDNACINEFKSGRTRSLVAKNLKRIAKIAAGKSKLQPRRYH